MALGLRHTLKLLLVGGVCTACATAPHDARAVRGADASALCVEGALLCQDEEVITCVSGSLTSPEACAEGLSCFPGRGCAACAPGVSSACLEDAVYRCGPDGQLGEKVEDCPTSCALGSCVGDCAPGSELIYTVDSDDGLYRFDPRTHEFTFVGILDCPAGAALPGFGDGPSHPFSMAVDRHGRARVLYGSGELFNVDTQTASCLPTEHEPGAGGFDLFGMAYVSDGPGSSQERLFIAGGAVGDLGSGRLASLTGPSPVVLGSMSEHEFGAELTGNGNGELFAYWPGGESEVARLDKTTGGIDERWSLPRLQATPSGWAFAHWGGRAFVFISTMDARGEVTSQILRFDPEGAGGAGDSVVVVADVGRVIVGAGVSTCAPVVSNF